MNPKGENALVGFAELAGTGQDAATIHVDRQIEGEAIFERQHFRGQFGGAVEGDRSAGGKLLRDAQRRRPGSLSLRKIRREGIALAFPWAGRPAGRENKRGWC